MSIAESDSFRRDVGFRQHLAMTAGDDELLMP